ncbi:hypothetical protein Tco_1071791 [Tanacetum coccineum]
MDSHRLRFNLARFQRGDKPLTKSQKGQIPNKMQIPNKIHIGMNNKSYASVLNNKVEGENAMGGTRELIDEITGWKTGDCRSRAQDTHDSEWMGVGEREASREDRPEEVVRVRAPEYDEGSAQISKQDLDKESDGLGLTFALERLDKKRTSQGLNGEREQEGQTKEKAMRKKEDGGKMPGEPSFVEKVWNENGGFRVQMTIGPGSRPVRHDSSSVGDLRIKNRNAGVSKKKKLINYKNTQSASKPHSERRIDKRSSRCTVSCLDSEGWEVSAMIRMKSR